MKFLLSICLLVLLSLPVLTKAAETSLLNRIDQAQKHLNTTEIRISNERQSVTKQLRGIEREVLALREQAAVAQRLNDEKTLSLSRLEERLESWQQQQVYQKNLLHRFLQQHDYKTSLNQASSSVSSGIARVITVAEDLQQRFQPTWSSAAMVMPSGEINAMPVFSVGPVTWYWDALKDEAGIASVRDNTQHLLHIDLPFKGRNNSDIAALRKHSEGSIVFDPTLTRALVREQSSESLLQHLFKGGLWAIPIILFAVFALIIALIKASQLFRLPKLVRFTPSALNTVLLNKSSPFAAEVGGMQKILLDITYEHNIGKGSASHRQRDDQLFMQLQDNKHWLERWIGGIAITAAISPLLGLLGTVSGMIETFKMMTLFGSGDPEVVSGGIAQALITTELGLVVAIPALILNALLSRRAKSYYYELESFAILISKTNEENSRFEPESKHDSKPRIRSAQKPLTSNTSLDAQGVIA